MKNQNPETILFSNGNILDYAYIDYEYLLQTKLLEKLNKDINDKMIIAKDKNDKHYLLVKLSDLIDKDQLNQIIPVIKNFGVLKFLFK